MYLFMNIDIEGDEKLTFGPFTEIVKGAWGSEMVGRCPDGTTQDLLEARIGLWFCDSCGPDSPEFYTGSKRVLNFEITWGDLP